MTDSKQTYHQQAYVWVSLALALPLFLWPAFLYFGFTPALGVSIEQNWLIAACCLLISAIVADSILSYKQQLSQVLASAIWIMAASSTASLAIRNPDMAWFIAALFALRSILNLPHLWRAGRKYQWWRWTAWWRDSSAALTMFLWLHYWPK